jgi:hypothetical protein
MNLADQVKEFARHQYIEPARRRGETSVRVVAGDVHRALRFVNRVPTVCTALRSTRFLEENGLILEKREGPPSGLGTKVAYTYRFSQAGARTKLVNHSLGFLRLRGIAKEVFRELGGAEQFLRSERGAGHLSRGEAQGQS